MPDLAIGLDFGTSGLKGVAVARDGSIVARARADYPTDRPEAGRAEQDPHSWFEALREVIHRLGAEAQPERWLGLGLSAMIPTLVALDARGAVSGPAITWEDDRAEAQAARLRATLGIEWLIATTGQRLDGRYLLPLAMWLGERAATESGKPARILAAKDWLFERLTGISATDPGTATGFGCYDLERGEWDEAILREAFGGQPPRLPDVRPSMTAAPLSAAAATATGLPVDLPVVLGGADSVLAARGLGVCAAGSIAFVSGTSTVILGVSGSFSPEAAAEHPYLVTPLERDGAWGLEMDLVSTGGAVGWLAGILGLPRSDEGSLWRLAEKAPPGAHDLALLPYLGPGEQGALWDPSLRGTLVGLTLATSRADLARALLDGTILESRRCIAVLEGASGASGPIVMTGPAARSAVFRQALADATGRLVRLPSDPDHPASAWGAASLAWDALAGHTPSPPEFVVGARPDITARSVWDGLMERHERAREATATLWRAGADRAMENVGRTGPRERLG